MSFPVVHRLLVFSRHTHPFTLSSHVKFPCFITLSISFPHFTSGRPRLPPSAQYIIILGHLLSSMRTTCPYHFNILFSILSKIVLPHFSLITSFLTFNGLEVLAALIEESIYVLKNVPSFSILSDDRSKASSKTIPPHSAI